MSSKTLAVSVGASRITGAVIESSIGSLRVVEVFDIDRERDDAAGLPGSDAIRRLGPFDRVIATLEPEAAAFRILPLPFRDRRRISQAVGPALEEHLPFSLDDGVLAWDLAAPADAAGAGVLAALAEFPRIEAARTRLLALGIEVAPQRLLWTPTLILGAYRRALGEHASFTAVDFGDGGALIARVDAGRLAALRIVAPCDDGLLIRNTAWSLATISATDGELAGAASELSFDGARVVAGGRHAARLAPLLTERTGIQTESLPLSSPAGELDGRDWRELTALAGLVVAAGGDAPAPTLDFESGAGSIFSAAALSDLQDEARPLIRWALAAAALALLAVGIDYGQLFAERRALAARAEQIYSSAMPSPSGGSGRKLKMEMRLRELSGKAGGAGSPLALLAALSRDVPKNLEVVVDAVEHSPPSAKVSGHAASFEAVTKMQQALQKGGAFARVEVKDVHAAVSGGGVEFLLDLATAPAEGVSRETSSGEHPGATVEKPNLSRITGGGRS